LGGGSGTGRRSVNEMRKLLLLCAPAALAFFYVTAPAARTSQTATAQQNAAQVPREDARRLFGRVAALDAAKKQIVVETRGRGDFEAVTLDASGPVRILHFARLSAHERRPARLVRGHTRRRHPARD